MRRFILAISIICLMFVLQGCSKHTTQLSDYGSWGKPAAKIINSNFSDSLPDKEAVNKYGKEYYYKFTQGLLSDENFVVYVVLQFPDLASYKEKLDAYTKHIDTVFYQEDTAYYAIQYSNQSVSDYTDDKIYDGMFFDFEIISANEKELMIGILNAHVWDYYKDQFLIDYLSEGV